MGRQLAVALAPFFLPFLAPFGMIGCSRALPPGGVPAQLVPRGTVAYVQATSLDAVESKLRSIMRAVDAEAARQVDLRSLLREGLGPSVDLQWIDGTKPLAVAVALAPGAVLPDVTFIVPTTSREAFVAAFGARQPPLAVEAHGEYVAWQARGSAPAPASGSNPIAQDLPRGLIAVRVDLARVVEVYRGAIDVGFAEIERTLPTFAPPASDGGIDVRSVLSLYLGAARGVIASAQELELAFDVQGSRVLCSQQLTAAPGSPMDGWGSDGTAGIEQVAHLVDHDAAFSACAAVDYARLYARIAPFLERLLAAYPAPLRELMASYTKRADSIARLLGRSQAISADLADGVLRQRFFVSSSDAAALLDEYERMLTAPEMRSAGLEVEGPSEVEIAGTRARQYRLSSESLARLGERSGGDPGTEALRRGIQGLYGEEDVRITLAAENGMVLFAMGGDDAYLAAALDRMASGPARAPSALEGVIAEVADQNPCFVARVGLDEILRAVDGILARAGLSQPVLRELPDFTIELRAGIAGRSWKCGVSLDLGELERFVAALEEAEAVQDRADRAAYELERLQEAIEQYAADNDGKPPSTLDVLVVAGPGGEPYLTPDVLSRDPWGNPYVYTRDGKTYRVVSYGSDGKPGGEGAARDIDPSEMQESDGASPFVYEIF